MFRYLLFTLLLFVVGCSSKQPNIDFDPEFSTASLSSYAILLPDEKEGKSLNAERIREAISHEMKAKGYTSAGKETADFHISFATLFKEDVPSNFSFGFGLGSFSKGMGTSLGLSHTPTEDEGSLLVKMIDPKTKKTFWQTTFTKSLQNFDSPKERREYFDRTIAEMLKAFPSKAGVRHLN